MIVSVRDPNILSNLDPQQLINYLIARGWQPENLGGNANNQESVWVLTASSGSEFDITLPLHRKTRSFALQMAEILETLEKKELKPALQAEYECYTGVSDLFVYFYERGFRLLKSGGHLSYITSNKYFRAGYGEKLR